MNLSIIEQSSGVAPLLVQLYDNHRLYSLARDEMPASRQELTGAVVELLEKDLGPRERELVSDVLISLMRQAEKDLRLALSERLSLIETAPLRVVLHIANDEIDIAAPMLRSSAVLSDLDLLYIIKGKDAGYWRAIAARDRLSDGVTNALAETQEIGTAIVLAGNDKIHLPHKALEILSLLAENSDDLAKPLLMRRDLPESIARNLYSFVGEELRSYIINHCGMDDPVLDAAIDDVILEFAEGDDAKLFMPTFQTVQAVEDMAEAGKMTLQAVMDVLQRGQYASFIAMFAKYSGMGIAETHKLLCEVNGKTLAVACKALNLSKGDLSRIYMMTQRLRSEDRIVDHRELLKSLSCYDRVTQDQAQRILKIKQN